MSSIKTVLFDLDGTLLDTEPDFTIILNRLLASRGHKPVSAARVRQTVSSGARALVSMGFGISEQDRNFSAYLEQLLDMYDEQIQVTRCRLFPEIERLLNSISSATMQWGIVTNKPSRFTLPLLEKVPALKDCPVVICRDQVARPKPSPDSLLLACEKAATKTSEAVYVGDHPRDVEAGKRAGMRTIAAAWGYLPEGEPIERWQADHVVRAAQDMEDLLGCL
ncbi:MAG: HAD family hydrolase [Pseudohongiellaceae bacterium]